MIKSVYFILNKNIKSGDYCLKNNKNIKIQKLIESINKKSLKTLKVKFLSNKPIKPKKSFLKSLPKWKADITIQKNIEKLFYNEIN